MLNRVFRLKRSFFVWASAISTICVLLVLVLLYRFGDAMSSPIMAARIRRLSSDFSEVLSFAASSNPYEQYGTSYPPLAILLFRPLALLCSAADKMYHADFMASPLYIVAYVAYFASSLAIICGIFAKILSGSNDKKSVFHICLFFVVNGGMMYAFFRGNIIMTALVFTMLFLALKDSESKVLRELALICLAIAGAIKIYPLIFGAFLLAKRKYFASLRVGVYFCALFVLPFLAFEGGLANIGLFIKNMGTFQYGENRLYQLSNMSISGLVAKVFGLLEQTEAVLTVADVLSKVLMVLMLLLCSFVAVFSKNDFRRALACAAAVCVVPSVSYYYVIVFMSVPLLYYFLSPCVEREEDRATLSDVLHGRESLAQIKDLVFWCSAFVLTMAVYVPMRFAMNSAIYIYVLVLGMAFLEVRILFNTRKQRALKN